MLCIYMRCFLPRRPIADLDARGSKLRRRRSSKQPWRYLPRVAGLVFSGGFLTLRLLPGRPTLLALDGNIVSRDELSLLTIFPKDSFQVLPGIMAK